jgi:hypothetical protein
MESESMAGDIASQKWQKTKTRQRTPAGQYALS